MKESGEDRLKCAINESTLSTAARSPFPDGEGKEEAAPPHLLEDRLKYAVYESTLSTAARSPFPDGEGYDTGIPLSLTQSLPLEGKVPRRGG